MFFFEGKIELYNILFLFIIPVGVPLLVFYAKRKLLWFSPLAAVIIGLILTAVFYPYFFIDLFNSNNEIGGGGSWVLFAVPIHIIVAIITVAILRGIQKRLPEAESTDCVLAVDSPTKGIMQVRVEQKKSGEIKYTLLDGISAEYGFSSIRTIAVSCPYRNPLIIAIYKLIMRKRHKTLPLISQEEMYNAAKDFIEQLGPSGYLDDGP